MSEKKPTGGAAFPRPASEFTKSGTLPDGNDAIEEQDGMTLRDWLAGQALQGSLACETDNFCTVGNDKKSRYEMIAEECYLFADAMIAARKE